MEIINSSEYVRQRKARYDFGWLITRSQMELHRMGEFYYYTPRGMADDRRYSGLGNDAMVLCREGWATDFALFDCTEQQLTVDALRVAWDAWYERKRQGDNGRKV